MKQFIFATLVAFGLTVTAAAEELRPATSEIEESFRGQILVNPQSALNGLMRDFAGLAPGGVYHMPHPSQIRAWSYQALRDFVDLRIQGYDLDRNGEISVEEADRAKLFFYPLRHEVMNEFLTLADENGDGALNPSEIDALPTRFADQNIDANLRPRRLLLRMDPAVFDLNDDRSVRREELVRYVELVATSRAAQSVAPAELGECTLPQVSDRAVITMVGGQRGGAALSDQSLAGQSEATQIVYLDLPDGTRPVYLLLRVEGPTIYKIGGAVERVEQVVLGHRDGQAGVIGVPQERVTFRAMSDCFPSTLQTGDGAERRNATSVLTRLLGRQIDHLILTPFLKADVVTGALTDRSGGPLVLTSAGRWRIEQMPVTGRPDPEKLTNPADRLKAQTIEDFLARYPSGLDTVLGSQIVSPGHVEAYATLPGAAGLNAWLASGIAVATGREDELKLLVPVLHLPADLADARPLTVLLRNGLPMPAGDPGNWTILSEDRSRCLAAHRCR